jgi:hypothetical protein
MSGGFVMAREGKTARQLEELIEERLGHRNFDLGVLPIEGQKGGFGARVFGGLTLNDSEQEQVDEIVRTLRTEYYLIEG